MTDLLPVFDPRPIQDLLAMGVEPGIVSELLAILEEQAPARMAALAQAVAAEDPDAAIPEAHRLKGSVGNMGLARFSDLAGQLEAHIRAGEWEPARELVKVLPSAYQEALAAFRAAFPEA